MRLYTKFMVWSVLNLIWIGVALIVCAAWLFFGTGGLLSHVLFQGGINTAMQAVAANLQYKPIYEWKHVVDAYSRSYGIRFHLYPLDCATNIPGSGNVPREIGEKARRLPRPHVALCPDPMQGAQPLDGGGPEAESGFLPAQTALYARDGGLYWYGRPLFVPDENHRLHYVLLAASSASFSGNGLYFTLSNAAIAGLGVLFLSFLWWWPFVLHLTRPIATLTQTAERIASGKHIPSCDAERLRFALPRKDEIGRLSLAVDSMAAQIMRQMWGQRRFIRHIAHELGSPIARTKFGLAVLESRFRGEDAVRLQHIIKDVEQLSVMIEDVLTYLRAEGLPETPHMESFPLAEVLEGLIEVEGESADVRLIMDEPYLVMRSDKECVRRAVGNSLRNAVHYAADAGPITVEAAAVGKTILIRVSDCGKGVPASDFAHLAEPFFRGDEGKKHTGGSGLGLSIVRHCVDLCGGTLAFSNREPHGFCVTMRFPA